MALNRRKPVGMKESEGEYLWENLEGDMDYESRLVAVADLGLQRKEYKGDYQGDVQQISLGLEIIGEGREDEETGEYLPRILWTRPFYIYSTMGEKGKEFEFYKIFEPKAKSGTVPDWEAQLDKVCNTYVINIEDGDKVYDNVESLSRIAAKYADRVEEATEILGIGDADDSDNPVTASLRGLAKHVLDKRVNPDEVEEEGDPKPKKKAAAKKKSASAKEKATTSEGSTKAKRKPASRRTKVDDEPPFDADEEDEDIPY